MLFFALEGSDELARRVAEAGGFPVSPVEERPFEGGEHKARPMVSVHGRDVFVLHVLNGVAGHSANDKLMRLLLFIAACKRNGAARVTAVTPYLPYSRKERQTKPRDPVNTGAVAKLFEACGTDALVTVDVHSLPAFQNAFRCLTVHLEAGPLLAARFATMAALVRPVAMSPDSGGVKRAHAFRKDLARQLGGEVGFAFMEKYRSAGVVTGSLFAGDVADGDVVIIDDMIVSGGTIVRAAEACRSRGARSVHVAATHALLTEEAPALLGAAAIDSVTVTDTILPVPVDCAGLAERLHTVSVAPLVAETIRAIHEGRPAGAFDGEAEPDPG